MKDEAASKIFDLLNDDESRASLLLSNRILSCSKAPMLTEGHFNQIEYWVEDSATGRSFCIYPGTDKKANFRWIFHCEVEEYRWVKGSQRLLSSQECERLLEQLSR